MSMTMYEEKQIIGGGHGGGGAWSMIILVVVVLWLLFRDGGRNDHHGGYPNACMDEPNYMVDQNISTKIAGLDRDILLQNAETREFVTAQNSETRALITAIDARNSEREYSALMSKIQTLELEKNFDQRFSGVLGAIASTNTHIDKIACHLPERPNYYASGYYAPMPNHNHCC